MLRILGPCAGNRIKLGIKFPFDLSGQSAPSLALVIKRLTTLTFYWGEGGRKLVVQLTVVQKGRGNRFAQSSVLSQ